LNDDQREYLSAVKESAEALLTLINDILDFSKIEAGKFQLALVDFRFRDFLTRAVTTLNVQARAKGLALVTEVSPEVPDFLVGDPGALRQILMNLIGNGIKFTERGEVAVRVRLEKALENQVVLHFVVIDSGIGIKPEETTRIFERFQQVDGSMTRKHGGTGLGLSISNKLIRMMDGDIWVESEMGQGSKFHFLVSLGIQKDAALAGAAGPPSLKDVRLLVVDDNKNNRCLLETMCSKWGMRPTSAETAMEALKMIEEAKNLGQPFEIVITDHMMPGMDGYEFARTIRERDLGESELKVIILTSMGTRGDAARCTQLGISAYLLKPVNEFELLDAVLHTMKQPAEVDGQKVLITRHSLRENKKSFEILLVEDNRINQVLAQRILEKWGHRVYVCNNGLEAVNVLDQRTFDLVLMDLEMPEMDGLQATRTIRDRERITGGHIPIFAMTAYARDSDKKRCLDAGMDGYVSKPINIQELFQTIETLIKEDG
jgi:CheY-like chemotaxis protein